MNSPQPNADSQTAQGSANKSFKRRPLTTALLLLCCAALSTACAASPLSLQTQPLPSSLTTCKSAPPPPIPDTQRDVALYIVDLWYAHADCYSKLNAIRDLTEPDE